MEDDRRWPKDVGIRAMHVVIPSLYVDQADLERYDRVSEGKYTVGLGQKQMGFCTDLEDVNSLCLTAVSQLVENNGLSYSDIGRLEVGTETLVDKSKSAKTVVMQLFAAAGNHRVEGVDTTNACYGGTAALFNALAWAESSAWDGRLAVVVAADIAVYAAGSSARATGGAGAVAMLVGPGAPLVVDRGLRGTYMDHAYDFYKPDLGSEYPVVDGQLSVRCYLNALDRCYESYRGECGARGHAVRGLDAFDSFVFHAPYCKLVRKALARLYAKDSVREKTSADDKAAAADKTSADEKAAAVDKTSAADKTSADDKAAEAAAMDRSRPVFEAKTEPSLMLASRVGNTYTASVYSGLASYLLSVPPERLAGKRIGVFSYGSGLASSMYSITVVDNGLAAMVGRLRESVSAGLRRRTRFTAEQFADALDVRRESLHRAPYAPAGDRALLFPGTWYLSGIDEMRRRHYERKE